MNLLLDTMKEYDKRTKNVTFTELMKFSRYLNIKICDKNAIAYIINIVLLIKPIKSLKYNVRWKSNLLCFISVPTEEPETRKGDSVDWNKLDYPYEARLCLQGIMKKFDIWDIEELLVGPPILKACARVLENNSSEKDREIIDKYYMRSSNKIRFKNRLSLSRTIWKNHYMHN